MAHDISAANLRWHLMRTCATQHVDVTRAAYNNGYRWSVTFTANNGNHPIMVIVPSLTGTLGTPVATTAELVNGARGGGFAGPLHAAGGQARRLRRGVLPRGQLDHGRRRPRGQVH